MSPVLEAPPTIHSSAPSAPVKTPAERLTSLDAYRGAIMLLMASAGLGIPQIARHYPDSALWRFLGFQTEHVAWTGWAVWDLIQPAFMFMVGVALPWSIANRAARGQTFPVMFGHALFRAVALILLSIFLQSNFQKRTDWTFFNVLAQIGFGYPIVFLLAFTKPRTQWIAAGSILFLYWLAFALYPLPSASHDWKAVGVPENWQHLQGFAAHWEKNANFASNFDGWFLNLFPRENPFAFNSGGYTTLNFIPSIATIIFGLLSGQLLRSGLTLPEKLKRLVIAGVTGILLGKSIELLGLGPIVKRVWTPSWAIFSGGFVVLLLAAFVAVIDLKGWKKWAFPLVVAGLNPITLYIMWQIMGGWIRETFRIHAGRNFFETFGPIYVPTLERGLTLLVMWLILYWMYRRKIFLRI